MEKYSQKYRQLNRDRTIIYSAQEAPFFRVRPDLTDLGQSPVVAREIAQKYPNLQFDLACVADGAILIQDMLAFNSTFDFETGNTFYNLARDLNKTSNITLQVVDGALSNSMLLEKLAKPLLRDTRPLVIFPGEGAKIVSEYMRRQERAIYTLYDMENALYIPSERTMREKGKFEMKTDFSSLSETFDSDFVLIIDDVISTGQTIQTIAKEVKQKYPEKKVIAMSWFMVLPNTPENKKSPSCIEGVDITIAAFAIRGNYVSRPPIISLSCFVRKDKEKYDEVKQSFAQKYIDNQVTFERILQEMRA